MKNIKKTFSEIKRQIPKHVQWLLMAAAFIVVIILLTLLLRPNKSEIKNTDLAPGVITINPDALDWSAVEIDKKHTQEFKIYSNIPVKIGKVTKSINVKGFNLKTTCTNIGQISDKVPCTISLEYEPKEKMAKTSVTILIEWRNVVHPEKMNRIEKIAIVLGTKEPVKEEIKKEADVIAPLDNSAKEVPEDIQPEPVLEPVFEPEPIVVIPENLNKTKSSGFNEACSDFAFPGYNNSGQQIGWIKPDAGAYYYYPFADKNCKTPTGIYNPDNGIITDIKDASKKIGTDAEHIGYTTISNGIIPYLSNPVAIRDVNKSVQKTMDELQGEVYGKPGRVFVKTEETRSKKLPSSFGSQATVSSQPYDRTFVLRQYKPIPATIVSEVRAVATENRSKLPVTATVDRHVYSDDGRTIIVPAGTMMLGSVVGDMPGPYKAIGRISIDWYRFVRPDGVEFNFMGDKPFSGDAQGRTGVPGRGSTDYVEQFVMPMLTAVVPAAVNLIAPISDSFVNKIDLDNNTVTQSGQVKSSELAKNEIITAWNKVAQKLMVDMMENTVPPFSIASGTRITVFSPTDLIVTCGSDDKSKECSITQYDTSYATSSGAETTIGLKDPASLIGQVRSFDLNQYCDGKGGVSATANTIMAAGLDYRTVVFYCQSNQYEAINNAKQKAIYENQQQTSLTNNEGQKMNVGGKDYNEQVLGLNYNDDGTISNPFNQPKLPTEQPPTLTCEDGLVPDQNGCCADETFTDMAEQGFNCCPDVGGDCFPPMI